MTTRDAMMRYLNERPRLTVRPSLLALAAFLASSPLYAPNARVLGLAALDACTLRDFRLSMTLASACAAVALVAVSVYRPDWRGSQGGACVACAVGYVLVQVAMLACLPFSVPRAISVLLGVPAGVLVVPVVLAWARLFATDLRNAMFYGALACMGSTVLTWVASLLVPYATLVLMGSLVCVGALTPMAAGGARVVDGTRAPDAVVAGRDADKPSSAGGFSTSVVSLFSVIWLPLIGFVIYEFVISAYSFPLAEGALSSESTGTLLASLLALVVCLARLRTPLVILVDTLVMPLCVAVCMILGSFPEGSGPFILGGLSVHTPLVFVSIYALASLAVVSAAGEFPSPFIVGVALVADDAATLLGLLVSHAFPDVNFGTVTWVVLCSYFALVMAWLGVAAWRNAMNPRDLAGCCEEDGDVSAGATVQIADLLARRLDEIGSAHNLTEREMEILAYLVRGHSSTYIGQCLFISANTARTHVRNIYRKLGVNSRDELFALVGREEAPQ